MRVEFKLIWTVIITSVINSIFLSNDANAQFLLDQGVESEEFCIPDVIIQHGFEPSNDALAAFPGAQGYGRFAGVGQPERDIYYVTNLSDSGPGSLRDALSEDNRYVLFKVSGTIVLEGEIFSSANNIHIAGQTAFVNGGEGITVRSNGLNNTGLISFDSDHVVMRYMRLRRGPGLAGEVSGDNLNIFGSNWMIDHSSFSWSTDENVSSGSGTHGTMQNSISSEGLYFSSHRYSTDPNHSAYQTGHSKGSIFGYDGAPVGELSFYNNLFAHNDGRNPRVFAPGGSVEVVNNLLYNNRYFQIELSGGAESNGVGMQTNVVKNLLIAGKDNRLVRYMIHMPETIDDQIYVQGNIGVHRTDDTQSEWGEVGQYGNPNGQIGRSLTSFSTPLESQFSSLPDAVMLDAVMLDHVGASIKKDAVDERVIYDVINKTPVIEKTIAGTDPAAWDGSANYYGIINDPAEVGGWPVLSPMSAVVIDSDDDGMADEWEMAAFGTLSKAAYGDENNNGWNNIDEYLHSLTGVNVSDNLYTESDATNPLNENNQIGSNWQLGNNGSNSILTVVTDSNSDNHAAIGQHALQTTSTAANHSYWELIFNGLTVGTEYKLSFDAKSLNASGTDFGTAFVTNLSSANGVHIDDTLYQAYSITIPAVSSSESVAFYATLGTEVGQKLWIDNIKLTEKMKYCGMN